MRPVDRTREVEDAIRRRVVDGAPTWFPGTAPRPTVRLQPLSVRPRAVLYAVEIGERASGPQVLAKVRREWPGGSGAAASGGRPRLAPGLAPAAEMTCLEYAGLREIHRIFGREDASDGRFSAIRPLDLMAAEETLLMEYVRAATLRSHLVARSRLRIGRSPAPGPDDHWRSAGAWLGVFQREMPSQGVVARQDTRDAVVERLDAFGDFLVRRLGPRAASEPVRTALQFATEVLPERLPLAVGHGDYAPRNVFVRAGGRLAAFDPMPRWRVPRYEDLARFLVAVRLSGSQVHSRGAAYSPRMLDHLEQLVIDGYRGEAGDLVLPELRALQLLVLLDRWSALVDAPSAGWRARLRGVPVELASALLRQEVRRLTGSSPALA